MNHIGIYQLPLFPSFLTPAPFPPSATSVTKPVVLLPAGRPNRKSRLILYPIVHAKGLISKKLFTFEMEDSLRSNSGPLVEHSVLSHITRLSSLAEKLRNLISSFTEQPLIKRTLHSLTSSYRPFQSSWLSDPVVEQTLLNLASRIVAEEAINNGETDPANIVFFAGKS